MHTPLFNGKYEQGLPNKVPGECVWRVHTNFSLNPQSQKRVFSPSSPDSQCVKLRDKSEAVLASILRFSMRTLGSKCFSQKANLYSSNNADLKRQKSPKYCHLKDHLQPCWRSLSIFCLFVLTLLKNAAVPCVHISRFFLVYKCNFLWNIIVKLLDNNITSRSSQCEMFPPAYGLVSRPQAVQSGDLVTLTVRC